MMVLTRPSALIYRSRARPAYEVPTDLRGESSQGLERRLYIKLLEDQRKLIGGDIRLGFEVEMV